MKKETLKLLKNIGVDTRYISYTPTTIYINDLRFSKFSRKKEETFKKYYPQTTIIRSGLLQKICNRASKILSHQLKPREKITLPKITDKKTELIHIILEPYTRKYGIQIIKEGKPDKIVGTNTLNLETYNILTKIFAGEGIPDTIKTEPPTINPLLNIPNEWIEAFTNEKINDYPEDKYKEITLDFMDFVKPIIPSYKENILQSRDFLKQ